MKPYKKEIVGVFFVMIYCVLISLLNPIIIQKAIDDYIATANYVGLLWLGLIALVLNSSLILMIRFRIKKMANICNKVLATIRYELYTHIQTLDFGFFDSRPTGKILARIIGDINALKEVLSNSVTTLLPDFLTICAVVVIMFITNAKLATAALITLPFMALALWFVEKLSHKRWQIHKKKSSNISAYIHEDIAGIHVVQSFSAEEETMEAFSDLVKDHNQSFLSAVRINDIFGSIIDISWSVGAAAMFYAGIVLIGVDIVSVGTLMAFATYIGMFWSPISNLANFYNQLISNITGAERIFEILDTKPAVKEGSLQREIESLKGEVTFKNVSFSYDNIVKILDNVSFHIHPGETIALVGPTGAGKTTIVNLISRFYDISSGQILIDGVDIKEIQIESLRKQMGVMTQDNFIFSGTVKDNIRYGKLDASEEEIIAAAKAVCAHDFIMKLKDGYDTKLQDLGGGLSVGQKQLIAFARTMIILPKILILDEATSSIDTNTELLVQKGIESLIKGRTSFVIAHRLSTIQKADRIFVIDENKIVEEGSPAELMKKKGLYYDLYMAQFKEVI